jgi:predicted nucleotidyltransferase
MLSSKNPETILSMRRKVLKEQNYKKALDKTNRAVAYLYGCGAQAVYIFGSLVYNTMFDEMSDVDIYVEGLPRGKQKGLFSALDEIFGEIKFDLFFDDDVLRPEIAIKIKKEGKLWKPS